MTKKGILIFVLIFLSVGVIIFVVNACIKTDAVPVGIIEGITFDARPKELENKIGKQKITISKKDEFSTVYYSFSSELAGEPAKITFSFVDDKWLSTVSASIEVTRVKTSEDIYLYWINKLTDLYKNERGFFSKDTYSTEEYKEVKEFGTRDGAGGVHVTIKNDGKIVKILVSHQ